ncbi:hypothetical protein JYB88_17530 [Shewanella cyperi]|uniref:CopL family metal-binding regulatory protein n=1 Tax=Shewanella cyperi TaxID=2814292 RepID=A0A974XME5_9GAMM|nr:hypothetical protein [Shewanella cyperi]QSX29953.1 hypothetical protein JYB88_17530 [Shewanella cyperi]
MFCIGRTMRQSLLVIYTLLALLGQAVLTNGYAMGMPEHEQMTMSSDNCDESQSHCCDMPMTEPEQSQGCCDSDTGCQPDCGHCLSISLTTGLIYSADWPVMPLPRTTIAMAQPHIPPVAPQANFRPPIA